MNETVREWIAKAEGDYHTAERELSAASEPNYDAVCFHAQQCAEKLLKGLLILRQVVPPKTHDLVELHRLAQPVCPGWSWPLNDLRSLSQAALVGRYPGESADLAEAVAAFETCKRIRTALLALLIPGPSAP